MPLTAAVAPQIRAGLVLRSLRIRQRRQTGCRRGWSRPEIPHDSTSSIRLLFSWKGSEVRFQSQSSLSALSPSSSPPLLPTASVESRPYDKEEVMEELRKAAIRNVQHFLDGNRNNGDIVIKKKWQETLNKIQMKKVMQRSTDSAAEKPSFDSPLFSDEFDYSSSIPTPTRTTTTTTSTYSDDSTIRPALGALFEEDKENEEEQTRPPTHPKEEYTLTPDSPENEGSFQDFLQNVDNNDDIKEERISYDLKTSQTSTVPEEQVTSLATTSGLPGNRKSLLDHLDDLDGIVETPTEAETQNSKEPSSFEPNRAAPVVDWLDQDEGLIQPKPKVSLLDLLDEDEDNTEPFDTKERLVESKQRGSLLDVLEDDDDDIDDGDDRNYTKGFCDNIGDGRPEPTQKKSLLDYLDDENIFDDNVLGSDSKLFSSAPAFKGSGDFSRKEGGDDDFNNFLLNDFHGIDSAQGGESAGARTFSMPQSLANMLDDKNWLDEEVDRDGPLAVSAGVTDFDLESDAEEYTEVLEHFLALMESVPRTWWKEHDSNTAFLSILDDPEIEQEPLSVLTDSTTNSTEMDTNETLNDEAQVEEQPVEHFELLMDDVMGGALRLPTKEYNLLLVNLATSSTYKWSDALDMMMQLYFTMQSQTTQDSFVDADTQKIIVASLYGRGCSPKAAMGLLKTTPEDGIGRWDSDMVVLATKCCRECLDQSEGERIINAFRRINGEVVPFDAYVELQKIYREDDKQEKALSLIDRCLEHVESWNAEALDAIVLVTVGWPRVVNNKQRVDQLSLLRDLLERLLSLNHESCLYSPSVRVWSRLLPKFAALSSSREDFGLAHEAATKVLNENPFYRPNFEMLESVLEVSSKVRDASLVVDLLQRAIDSDTVDDEGVLDGDSDTSDNSSGEKSPAVYPSSFRLAIEACILARDSDALTRTTALLENPSLDFSGPMMRELYNLAIRGIARVGDPEESHRAVYSMLSNGFEPSEALLGEVIHSLARADKIEEAIKLFDELKSGEAGIDVGLGQSCFNGKILALLKSKDWSEVTNTRMEMESMDVLPNAITLHGWLIAYDKLGEKDAIVGVLEDALTRKIHLNASCFQQALKSLTPELVEGTKSLQDVRARLRTLSEEGGLLKKPYLNLTKNMWSALIEEERKHTRNLRAEDIERRRQKEWRSAVESLLALAKAMQ